MSSGKKPPLILVDGSSYLYRAFHALPPLVTQSGQPTGAIHGVLNMVQKLRMDESPSHMAVVFDPKGPTLRDEWYSHYKSNRPPMPEDLRRQIAPLCDALRSLGFPVIIEPGIEADDVIGTLTTLAREQGFSVLISTGDKDMAQLVDGQVTLLNTMSNTRMDPKGVVHKFGVAVHQIIDYLALMGDSVDNVPGVPGVGPKTAAKWIAEYGSLAGIMEHADDIKGKVGEKLRAHLHQLPLSIKLVTICCDLTLAHNISDLMLHPVNFPEIRKICHQLEMKRFLKQLSEKIEEPSSLSSASSARAYQTIVSKKDLSLWQSHLETHHMFALDTETTGLNPLTAELVGISLAVENHACYIPLGHKEDIPQLSRREVFNMLTPILSNPDKQVIGHNLKYDWLVLQRAGLSIQCAWHDTMLISYVLNSTSRHDLDSLAMLHLQHQNVTYAEVAGMGAKQICFSEVSIAQASTYAAEDADVTYRLFGVLYAELKKNKKLLDLYQTLECPLILVLAEMESQGILLDADLLKKQSASLAEKISQLEARVYEACGEKFNLSSPKQLQHILYDKLKLPVLKKTPKGQPSTAEPVLQDLAYEHNIVDNILQFRHISKLKSTYTDSLPLQALPPEGRVHTSFNQAVTSTGRLSSTQPNLQNIPIRTQEGRRIRDAFIAPYGKKLVSADYSQIELRIMAHMSEDKGLLDAFSKNLDVHQHTASEVFSVARDEVTEEQRRRAKAINFGLMYGMSAFGLAKQLKVSRQDAQSYIDVYFERYPGVLDYMERTKMAAREQGYVETLLGRRLLLPEINAKNMARQNAAQRAAINAPLQGTAADIIKLAMISVHQWLGYHTDLDLKMILQVHDELIFEAEKDHAQKLIDVLPDLMGNVVALKVPLLVSIGQGRHWGEAH